MSRQTVAASFFLLATLPAMLAAQTGEPDPSATTPPTATTATGEWYRGLTSPSKQVTLKSSLDGLLADVLVEEGQHVKKGQLLAQLDDGIQQIAVQATQLEAEDTTEIHHAQLLLAEAEYELEQTLGLFEKQAATDLEVRRGKLRRDQAEANVAVAHKNKALAKMKLEREIERLRHYRTAVQPPTSRAGILVATDAEPGATIQRDTPLIALAKLDTLESHLYLPVELYGQLKVGEYYDLQADVPVNRTLKGKLIYCEPRIDLASHTFRCVFEIDNPDATLPSGFMVQLLWQQDSTRE